MSAAAILAIIQLATQLAPPAIELVNNLMKSVNDKNITEDELMKLLTILQSELKPMEMK